MRGMRIALILIAFVLTFTSAVGTALAQSDVATGEVLGVAKDADGSVLPGVTVEVKNPATGFARRMITDSRGNYRFNFLPVGTYNVKCDLTGFKTEVKQGIQVALGSSARIDFALSVGAMAEQITVSAAAPVVETSRPDIANSVGDTQIASLPLTGRNFLDFVALTPQSYNDDEGRTHIGGQRGIQNSFNVDGTNAQSNFFGEQRGGTRAAFNFSQAAIKEFQVIPSSYNVQFGRASGGVINAVTKSGTNQVKGDLWYYYRDRSMSEKNAAGNKFRDFKQQQYGVSVGGPLIKDKLHYFVSYDGQRRTDPFVRQWDKFPADKTAQFEAMTGLTVANELGDVPFTNDVDSVLAKLDWQVSPEFLLTARDNYATYTGKNGTYQTSRTGGRSNNGLEKNKANSAVINLNAVFSTNVFNEFFVQFAKEERPRYANVMAPPETYIYEDRSYFGRVNYLPNNLIEERTQFVDNITYFMGNHSLKAGFNIDLVKYDNWYFRYGGGYYQFNSWSDFFAKKPPARFRQGFSAYNGVVKFDVNTYAGYLQDEWRVNRNLTFTIGLRYDLQSPSGAQEVNPKLPNTGVMPKDKNNWAPRIGFAWDPAGNGKTVVRAGFGYFYDSTPALIYANAMLNNGVRVMQVDIRCSTSAPCPTYPNLLTTPGSQPQSVLMFDPDFKNPRTRRASLGFEHQVARDLSLGAEVIYSETDHLERIVDLNLVPVGWTQFGTRYYSKTKRDPAFTTIGQFTSDASAHYFALVLKARKRWSDRWLFDGSYTYSSWRDNNSNERTVSVNSYAMGEDPLNINNDWGPGDYDITHKFVASAVVLLPWDIQVATIATARSGLPFTPTDYRDLNNDGNFNDRAYLNGIHYGRNSKNQPWYYNMDLRLSKIIRFGGFEAEIIGEAFNVFAFDNWRTDKTELVDSKGQERSDFSTTTIPGSPRMYQVAFKFRF